jgi:SAM-dependent methyltransferase
MQLRDTLALRYGCDRQRLPAHLAERFAELGPDEELANWLEAADRHRASWAKTGAQRLLRQYVSDFDANAVLAVYPMYLLSSAQWRRLLGPAPGQRLLDVGAGSGDVTSKLAPLFEEIITTEVSRGMAWKLRRRGFRCLNLDAATEPLPDCPYDVISCLNVLDRCRLPLSLLARLREALADGGQGAFAVPLPYSPHVYDGPQTLDPTERLACRADTWEEAAAELCTLVLEPLGYVVQSLSRAPYLSGGDSKRPVYELDAAIIVCRREEADQGAARTAASAGATLPDT